MPNFYGKIKNNNLIGGACYTYYTKKYKIVYDGEIYNSVDVKMELLEIGHTFSTFLEEEIVLKAYIEWGERAVAKFDGAFSIAIFDVEKNTLLIATDSLGIKPVYYRLINNEFIFANRMEKLNVTKYTTTYDKMAYLFLFGKDSINTETVFNSINILPAGNILIYSEKIEIKSYECFDLQEDYVEKIFRRIIPDTNISTLLFESKINIMVPVLAADILNRVNRKPQVFTYDNIDKIKNNYEIEEKRLYNDFSINNFYKIVNIKEMPSEIDFSKFYMALKNVTDKSSFIVNALDYSLYRTNYDLIKAKSDLFSKEFEENIYKEKIINTFINDIEQTDVLKNREKIAKYFGLTLRDIVVISRKEFLKTFYELIKLNMVKIPKNYDKIYRKILLDEYEHIINIPTARVFEVVDREKVRGIKDIRVVQMILELNYWLKEYNVEIL